MIASAGDSAAVFKPYRTVARFAETASPHYWVAPLLNFVVDFRRVAPSLQEHPLRTRVTAPLATSEAGVLPIYHESFHKDGNALIPFLCEGEPAFIEPLPDYAERRVRAEAGESVVTAVAVGRTPDGFDLGEPDWFPADLVTLLGLSSGRTVAVPFVEIRGEAGELVARMHVRIGEAGQSRGTALIDEQFNGSTGPLLTSFLVSDVRDAVWFRVMLKHLLRAFTGGGTVEDRLSHLFRAVEGASVGLGLTEPGRSSSRRAFAARSKRRSTERSRSWRRSAVARRTPTVPGSHALSTGYAGSQRIAPPSPHSRWPSSKRSDSQMAAGSPTLRSE